MDQCETRCDDKIGPINPHGDGCCKRERCALWERRKNDSGTDISKCGLLLMAEALVHLATVGMDVYPG